MIKISPLSSRPIIKLASPPVVKVMMMQKNEGPRLARWLTHYAALFGMENLLIFDNGSEDPYTINLLEEAERCGAFIRYDLTSSHDFQNKGVHFTNTVHTLNHECEYDFALPVDCDELLCVFTNEGLSLNRNDIMAEFDRLLPCKSAFSIGLSLFNLPRADQEGWYSPNRHFPKGFLPAHCDVVIDNGQHVPSVNHTPERKPSRFTYLHSHNRPYEEMLESCRAKLRPELDNPDDVLDPDKLREHLQRPNCAGGHLALTLLKNQEEYECSYQDDVQLYFREGLVLIRTKEGQLHIWNASAYLTQNPDTYIYEEGPLAHYLTYGAIEGRSLS